MYLLWAKNHDPAGYVTFREGNIAHHGFRKKHRFFLLFFLIKKLHLFFLSLRYSRRKYFFISQYCTRKKKYGRCSDTMTNNTQGTIRATLIYLMQPYDTSNSYILFSTAVLSPEWYCMSTGMQRFIRIRARERGLFENRTNFRKPVTCAVSVYTLWHAVCIRPIYFLNALIDKYHKSEKWWIIGWQKY